ncbi:PilZ domain-containing protein [Rhizobium sp. TRM95111]|uniref:PilZ domain-containing protein n=1 Tax=Rhizobium alarense TaxID=2846851 RepID=UPI001F33C76A|nr:PilZ domain-containing protein [Rhizobium alarense]MCF3642278.1 PilZ domain-containing protein [Rhizobium alarense]
MMKSTMARKERAVSRSRVRIHGTLKLMQQSSSGRIVNLSRDGMAIDLERPIRVMPGQQVEITTEELGQIDGVVRWCANGRIGIQYRMSSRAVAQIASYFRFFHREVVPVLRG